MPELLKHLKAEEVRSRIQTHLEAHGLLKSVEQPDGTTKMVVEARPAFDRVYFFARLDEVGLEYIVKERKIELYTVPSKALATQMTERGYTQVFVNHLTDDVHLPPSIRTGGSGSAGRRGKAPKERKLPPGGLPSALGGDEETAAAQVVREWEVHVEVDGEYFSPCYLWSVEARKAANYSAKVNDNFNQRSKVYCYIKEECTPPYFELTCGLG